MELRIQTASELFREEKTVERIIDMVLNLLVEIEEGDIDLLEVEKQFIPSLDLGAERIVLTYKRRRVPFDEIQFNVMKKEGMV